MTNAQIVQKFLALTARISFLERRVEKLESLAIPVAEILEFYTIVDGKIEKVETMFLQVTKSLPLSIAFKDKAGNVAGVEGAPKWAVSDEKLASLKVADDGMSATVLPTGALGSFKVQVLADADLGLGVKEIMGELAIDLVGGEAVVIEITAGEPVEM